MSKASMCKIHIITKARGSSLWSSGSSVWLILGLSDWANSPRTDRNLSWKSLVWFLSPPLEKADSSFFPRPGS